jgi:glucokinase
VTPSAGVRIGIDVGGTRTKWVAMAGDEVTSRGTVPTPADGPAGLAVHLRELAASLGEPVAAVGLALPAVIDRERNQPSIAPNLPPSWTSEPVASLVSDAVGAPVAVCNDARAFALAEATVGAGAGRRIVACVTLGTGVGGGVVIDGRAYGGRADRAGEFGHLIVEPEGALCRCGGRGCLEAYAGGRRLAEAAGLPTPKAVFDAARRGDAAEAALVAQAGRALAIALANISILFAPDAVVVGGGVGNALADLRPILDATLGAQSTVVPPVHILPASLGDHAGAIGAALWKDQA